MRRDTAWLKSVLDGIPGAVNVSGQSQVFVSKAEYPGSDPDNPVALTYPYWVIHPSDGRDMPAGVTGPRVVRHPRFTLWSVGKSADQAAIAAENARNALVVNGRGVVPTIEGEKSERVDYSSPLPLQIDMTKTPALVYHVAEISYDSQVI